MFTTARKAAKVRLIKPYNEDETLELPPQCKSLPVSCAQDLTLKQTALPESYSLAQLYDELVGDDWQQNTNVCLFTITNLEFYLDPFLIVGWNRTIYQIFWFFTAACESLLG
jgi:hypothetical protein